MFKNQFTIEATVEIHIKWYSDQSKGYSEKNQVNKIKKKQLIAVYLIQKLNVTKGISNALESIYHECSYIENAKTM